jgi:hypothetical protein
MNKGVFPGVLNLLHDMANGADIAVEHGDKLAVGLNGELQAGVVFYGSNDGVLAKQV